MEREPSLLAAALNLLASVIADSYLLEDLVER
jgi:hypothetical protein